MGLTVMTYNIRNGGGDRLDAIARVVGAVRPDLLAVQELGGDGAGGDGAGGDGAGGDGAGGDGAGGDGLRRLAGLTGMRPYQVGGFTGQPVGLLVSPAATVLAAGRARRLLHHAAARVTVDTDHGPLTVISAHLYPYLPGPRRFEARRLGTFARDRSRMVLLMGDLNALDPWTDHRAAVARLRWRYRIRQRTLGRVDTGVVRTLTRAGFEDLLRRCGNGSARTVPTAYAGAEFLPSRLDYVLATPPVAALARDCRVVTGGEAEVASDHYPVVAELDLNFSGAGASEPPPPGRR